MNDLQSQPGWHTHHPESVGVRERLPLLPSGYLLEQVDIIYSDGKASSTGPLPSRKFQWKEAALVYITDYQIQLLPNHQAIYWIYEMPATDFPEVLTTAQLLNWAKEMLSSLSTHQPLATAAINQLKQLQPNEMISAPVYLEYSIDGQRRSLYLSRHLHPNGQEVLGMTLAVHQHE